LIILDGENKAVSGGLPSRQKIDRRAIAPVDGKMPGYIKACHFRNWTLSLWRKDEHPITEDGRRWKDVPYNCRSWRHAGACAKHRAAEDVERIKAALSARQGHYVYVVLTFARESFDGDFGAAYRGIVRCWDRLRKRIVRDWGKIEYVCVVERHADGWPHINLLIRNERLAASCEGNGWKRVRSRWLEPEARACGFGFRTWIEPMRSEAIATYLVKLAGEMGKKAQVPLDAPRHFRRLRGSRGFLPPKPKDLDLTGRLWRKEIEEVEQWGLSPLPAYQGRPTLMDVAEPGGDLWQAYCDVVEPEPGCRVVQRPYTREVLWISYSFQPSRASPSASSVGPSGGCDDEAPAFSDSDGESAEQWALPWGWPEGLDLGGIFHGEG